MSEEDIISDAEKTVRNDFLIFLCSSLGLYGFYKLLIVSEESSFILVSLVLIGLGGYFTVAASSLTDDDHKIVRENGRNGFLKLFAGIVFYFIVFGLTFIGYIVFSSVGLLFR